MRRAPDPDDTIAALASAPGSALRSIIRLTGPGTSALLTRGFSPADSQSVFPPSRPTRSIAGLWWLPPPWRPVRCQLLVWPTGRSYTGQPAAEIHLHGSPPLAEAVLAALFDAGARPALAGEFTLRAFLAGRLDLVQAEAVLGVIDAVRPAELDTALNQLAGGVSDQLRRLRGDLLDLLADVEAGLDFADEHLDFVTHDTLVSRLASHASALQTLAAQSSGRMVSNALPRVVLVGPPNAGKSTLFNALARREAALVSSLPGTTRDWLEADLDLAGRSIRLVDTPGEDSPTDPIDHAAQRHRADQLTLADLLLVCHPLPHGAPPDSVAGPLIADTRVHAGPPILTVWTKADLAPSPHPLPSNDICISAHTGQGLSALRHRIATALHGPAAAPPIWIGSTAARCHDSLSRAQQALDRALELATHAADQDLLALELRDALAELADIVGAVYTDDLLDRIFSRFCIGK